MESFFSTTPVFGARVLGRSHTGISPSVSVAELGKVFVCTDNLPGCPAVGRSRCRRCERLSPALCMQCR